jgi:hypothetical protein
MASIDEAMKGEKKPYFGGGTILLREQQRLKHTALSLDE